MSRESKDLKIYTNKIVDDIFDHYDDYDAKDKHNVHLLLEKMKAVNISLKGYDNTTKAWYVKWLEAIDEAI